MKTRTSKNTAAARREAVKALSTRLTEAERQAAATKSAAIAAKAKAKETRKAYKQAKRIAKAARKAVKALKKELRTLKERMRLARARRARRKIPVPRVKRSTLDKASVASAAPLSLDIAPPAVPSTPHTSDAASMPAAEAAPENLR